MNTKITKTEKITFSAMMIAIAVCLAALCAAVPFLNLPFGGGFTIASMLPIIVVAYRYGTRWGLLTGFIYSFMQMILGFNTVSAFFLPGDSQMIWWQAIIVLLLDYVVAYSVLGFGGIFRNRLETKKALVWGSAVALFLRYVAHILSGAIFFGSWAEWFFTQEGFPAFGAAIIENISGFGLSLVYSVIYNGTYMIPEIIITAVAAIAISRLSAVKKAEEI